jgi:hypothetical protein
LKRENPGRHVVHDDAIEQVRQLGIQAVQLEPIGKYPSTQEKQTLEVQLLHLLLQGRQTALRPLAAWYVPVGHTQVLLATSNTKELAQLTAVQTLLTRAKPILQMAQTVVAEERQAMQFETLVAQTPLSHFPLMLL